MSKQTEAQRLSDELTPPTLPKWFMHMPSEWHPKPEFVRAAAAELLRQEALISELAEALRNISLQCPRSHLPPGLTPSDFGNYDDYSSYISALNFGSVGDIARAALAKVKQ